MNRGLTIQFMIPACFRRKNEYLGALKSHCLWCKNAQKQAQSKVVKI